MSRVQTAFGALVLAQAAHSTEEYVGRLWESFPPARFVSGLISDNLQGGFVAANVMLVAVGFWSWMVPVRRDWPIAAPLAWTWVALEVVNGTGHVLWAIGQGGYAPGVATAPLLLIVAMYLARQLWQVRDAAGAA